MWSFLRVRLNLQCILIENLSEWDILGSLLLPFHVKLSEFSLFLDLFIHDFTGLSFLVFLIAVDEGPQEPNYALKIFAKTELTLGTHAFLTERALSFTKEDF